MRAAYCRSIPESVFQSRNFAKNPHQTTNVLGGYKLNLLGGHLITSVLYDYKESQTNINLTKVSLVYLGGFFYVIPLPLTDETSKLDFL